MKKSTAAVFALITAILGAIALTGLRYYQLWYCMDENGLLIPGSRVAWGFAALFVVIVAALVFFLVNTDKTPGKETALHRPIFVHLLSALAGAGLMAGCAMYSFKTDLTDLPHIITYTVGVLAGALLIISDALRIWGKKSNLILLLIPTLFLAARLIFDFKAWSADPIVIDFCFKLLASVTAMLACFNLAAFPINYGKKRATIFFCLLSFVFSAMTAADFILHKNCTTKELLVYASLGVWSLINGLMLLLPQKEQPAETTNYDEQNDTTLL